MMSTEHSSMLKPKKQDKKKKKSQREGSANSLQGRKKVVAPVELSEEIFKVVRVHEDEEMQSMLESSIDKKR